MKILIVGGGGREHAITWRLSKSPSVTQLFAAPGNPGISQFAKCVPAPPDVQGYAALAEHLEVDLTVVGPEAPLVAGIVDEFRSRGMEIVGPTQAAAQLEGSKIFAKRFFERAGIPTARSVQVESVPKALESLRRFNLPVVIKADGLAAGKGVVIAGTHAEAEEAVQKLGPYLVIEEFLTGEEVSFIGLSNGKTIVPFTPSQDHKRAFDGDKGPNTGGMGAYCDAKILNSEQTGQVMDRVMMPCLEQMAKDGMPYTGFLYAGLMMTSDGPKVLEFNVRMGDPETQAILYSFESDFAEFLRYPAAASASFSRPSVCVVLAAAGYPDQPRVGDPIAGIGDAENTGAFVFQAGTMNDGSALVTNGGRVVGVTASGATLQAAIEDSYRAVDKIQFAGMQYRKDIGQKGLRRW